VKPAICRSCGKAEWNHVCSGSAAPDPPRSNAPSPSRRTPDRYTKPPSKDLDPPIALPAAPPGKPDTAPPLVTPLITEMSDEELRPFYNEVLRRKMKARRARKAK
jgi:hypothetical protein